MQEVRLGSKFGGRVAAVPVREGQLVEPGSALVTFEPQEWDASANRPPSTSRPRGPGGARVLKVWDAHSGKELLALRPAAPANVLGPKRLTFAGDGRRLTLAELASEPALGPRAVNGVGRDARSRTCDEEAVNEVTRLLEAANRGDKPAAADLLPLVYGDCASSPP